VLELDLDDVRAGGEDQSLRELLLADHADDRSERRPRVGVEGAAEIRDVRLREPAEHHVNEPRG
jgi:hypothetical protein